ncbi:hypothetical protein [Actinomadura latina]|uniref:FtsX-like permease family protein n=1 Tax=Actinomadura latina TaxID=163603 RepID=A0A846Z130_9ACTN|nr:hypothetical protein [Actinomadura latina]NKZ04418.1 hypothetical protein [Actinomadura latina]
MILFVGTAVGTLFLQATENAAMDAAGLAKTAEQKSIETLNFVVIGMVVLFTAIMLVNTIVPFGLARRGSAVPGGDVRIYLAVAALAAVLTGATAYGAARRTIRVPAVEAALR